MKIIAVGISYKTASIAIRERFYLNIRERELFLSELKSDPSVAEAVILSTCNRTEIYANAVEPGAVALLEKLLFKIKHQQEGPDLRRHFYVHSGEEAIRHLLRVSCGLDSLVIGEKQILGQIKEAADLARSTGMMSKEFNILLNIAIRAGKKAQTETAIGSGGVSVSWAAVKKAQSVLGDLRDKSVLIIGAGKMSKLAAHNLTNKGIGQLYVMNRTCEKAASLARQVQGTYATFEDIKEILTNVDVCICSASAPHYLVEKDLVREAMAKRGGKRLVLIDVSIPRNIDPQAASLDDVLLITIDDLDEVVQENVNFRHIAVAEVEEIITKKIREFNSKLAKFEIKSSTVCQR